MQIYRSKTTGELLKLVRKRATGINTYVQVDQHGEAILKRRSWSNQKQEQYRLISDSKSLIEVK